MVLDANHPLAGMALRLRIRVHEVREASADEIEAGSVGTTAIGVLDGSAPGTPIH